MFLNNLSNNRESKEEILFLNPVFTHNIWGGNRLRRDFQYPVIGDDIGECWGVAAHSKGDCIIRDGKFAGRKLSELWEDEPQLFGNLGIKCFPLLVKIIDAKEKLSIQVHPDNFYAKINENGSLGKTECWYIIDCPKGASVVVGHNAQSKEELVDMIQSGRWKELVREIPVKKGDFIQIEPGTMHTIKGGLLLLEIQQNSDITYRVYDYDRLVDGKSRELHVKKSVDVISVPAKPIKNCLVETLNLEKDKLNLLYTCEFYRVYKMDVEEKVSFMQEYSFLVMSVLEGEGFLNEEYVKKGDHLILPYGFGQVLIKGRLQAICVTL